MTCRDPIEITSCPMPANSGTVCALDSTRRTIEAGTTSASAHVPGSYRHHWSGGRVAASVSPTVQDVTVTLEVMSNSAGTTAAAFETDTTAMLGGSFTVTAGATKLINWLPLTPDFRIRITAGATAPTALRFNGTITWDRTSGA